jgi:leucyl aminopeptidase (aminopeptidase T)
VVDAARETLLHVLNLKPEESVLVVTGEGCHTIGNALAENDEIPFRIVWITEIITWGERRPGYASAITEETMNGGPTNVNYEEMVVQAKEMLELLKDAQTNHMKTPAGTDIMTNVEGRDFITDIQIGSGKMGSLPAGRDFLCTC